MHCILIRPPTLTSVIQFLLEADERVGKNLHLRFYSLFLVNYFELKYFFTEKPLFLSKLKYTMDSALHNVFKQTRRRSFGKSFDTGLFYRNEKKIDSDIFNINNTTASFNRYCEDKHFVSSFNILSSRSETKMFHKHVLTV